MKAAHHYYTEAICLHCPTCNSKTLLRPDEFWGDHGMWEQFRLSCGHYHKSEHGRPRDEECDEIWTEEVR